MARWSDFSGTAEAYGLRVVACAVGRRLACAGPPVAIFRSVLGAIAEAALSRPRAMLGGAAVVLVAFAVLAAGAPARLGVGTPETAGSQSAQAADDLAASLHRQPEPGMLIVTHGRDPVDSGVYRVALDVLTSQAKSDPDVAAVRRGAVSEDRRTTVLEIYFRDDDPAAQQRAVERISDALDPGPLTVEIAGEAATALDARRSLGDDVLGLELLALPLTLLVIALVVGLRLIAAPLLAAALAAAGAAVVLRVLADPLDLSLTGVLPAAIVGLALGMEFSLLLARRHRDELESNADVVAAVRRVVRVTGRPIAVGSLAGAVVPLALLAMPLSGARSAAVGSAAAALLAGCAALAVTPSLLVLGGPGRGELDPEAERPRWFVPRLSGWVGERRLAALLVVVVSVGALIAVAWSALDTKTVALNATGLPADAGARRAEDRLTAELGIEASSRATVSLPVERRSESDRFRRELEALDGVASIARPVRGGEIDALDVGIDARRGSLAARDAIGRIRTAAASFDGRVAGYDAAALDADDELTDRLPIAAALAAAALAVLIFWFARRPFLALGLGIASLLPAAGALGLLELVFADGRLTGPLDYAPQGAAQLDAVLAVAAGVAAVSAARSAGYPIVLRGERVIAVRQGAAERVARLVLPPAGAATVIAAATAAVLVGTDVLPVKQAGPALAAGLVLDLVLLRVLLVPALGRLLQRARP
jgi:trehalose monomycolate/heme transporter